MEKFIFTEELHTKVKTIDFQHGILIDFINDLIVSFDANDKESISKSFYNLARFTKQHFQYEEMIFSIFQYKNRKKHSTIHNKLLDQVGEYAKRVDEGGNISFNDVVLFLKQWLTDHIQREDRQYISFMAQNKVP